jgi:hypothetical protein
VSQTGEKKWSLVLDLKEMNPVTIASYDSIRDASQALDELNRQIAEGEERERAWAAEGRRVRVYASELLGDSLLRSMEEQGDSLFGSMEEQENGHRD